MNASSMMTRHPSGLRQSAAQSGCLATALYCLAAPRGSVPEDSRARSHRKTRGVRCVRASDLLLVLREEVQQGHRQPGAGHGVRGLRCGRVDLAGLGRQRHPPWLLRGHCAADDNIQSRSPCPRTKAFLRFPLLPSAHPFQ